MTLISNGLGAHRKVTTFVSGRDDGGEAIHQPGVHQEYRANAAVAFGEVVNFVAGTASVSLSVTPMAAATANQLYAGVAMNGAAAGEIVKVAQFGHAIVKTGDVTTELGEYILNPTTTTGVAVTAATAIDATTIAGTILGTVTGTETDGFTPVFLKQF